MSVYSLMEDVDFKMDMGHTETHGTISFKIGKQYCSYIFKKEILKTRGDIGYIKKVCFRKTFIERGYGGIKYMDIEVEEDTE